MVCVKPNNGKSIVAVTGASGYIGSWVVQKLLDAGYHVRAVVRDIENEVKTSHLRAMAKGNAASRLTFFSGDLFKESSYDSAFNGADAVVHTAAVVLLMGSKNPQKEIVDPSVHGAQNVLNSLKKASSASVKRLVFTSSIAAIYNLDAEDGFAFSEADFNNFSTVENGDAYGVAKVTAEKLIWDQCKGAQYDVTAICPNITLGVPLTVAHTKASVNLVRNIILGRQVYNITSGLVDVQDVATAHVNAIALEKAGGQRYILNGMPKSIYIPELSARCQRLYPNYVMDASPYPSDWIVSLAKVTNFAPTIRRLLFSEYSYNSITKSFTFDNTKSIKELGIQYTPLDVTLKQTVDSMINSGWVTPRTAN
eukprot:CFRG0724T1